MAYECVILADSVNSAGDRLTTWYVKFPRFILAEFNTHRMFSRNFESSRARSVKARIREVEQDPFTPASFGSVSKRMQAGADLTSLGTEQARDVWLDACRKAVISARALAELQVHQQLANRLIEPFSYVRGIVSATETENFFGLRCHPDAQPEFQTLAWMMRNVLKASIPTQLADGGWHLPLVADIGGDLADVQYASAGRCARVSYGDVSESALSLFSDDVSRALRLKSAGHLSPFEHPAVAASSAGYVGNFRGFKQLRKFFPGENNFKLQEGR